jgi:hypothetical protein
LWFVPPGVKQALPRAWASACGRLTNRTAGRFDDPVLEPIALGHMDRVGPAEKAPGTAMVAFGRHDRAAGHGH